MSGKITDKTTRYKSGFEPDLFVPKDFSPHRYALGKKGCNPLVTICMNPSAARDTESDRTINRIISVSEKLNSDGWIVFNLYPERATNAIKMDSFKSELLKENLKTIRKFLKDNNISEVWGAWGDNRFNLKALNEGKDQLLKMLSEIGVKVFYFGTLTRKGNPRHPLQRHEKWDLSNKKYLEL